MMANDHYDPFEARASGRYPDMMPLSNTFEKDYPDDMMGQGGETLPGLAVSGNAFGTGPGAGYSYIMTAGIAIGAIFLIAKILEK